MRRFVIGSGVGRASLSFDAPTGGPALSHGSTAGLRRTAGPPPLSYPSSGGSAGVRWGSQRDQSRRGSVSRDRCWFPTRAMCRSTGRIWSPGMWGANGEPTSCRT